MALNPFFLQGSQNEQRLVQELINEHLRIYGVEIVYIPRKFIRSQSIIKEIQSSKFDDNFALEAYINNYDGYSGQGDILTKFGVNLKDELSLVISKERFEDFISPFLETESPSEITISSRPREGDLVYFPLGQRIFEIKFVENEQPFYQLGQLYMYELKCELFEYEDEVIETTIDEIDTQIQDEGYITTLQLVGTGRTATASASIGTSYVREIFINDDGYGYTSIPIVSISTSPTGDNATAVAITTSAGGVYSIFDILLTNAGSGYTEPPSIDISGGGGIGAAATCSIETTYKGILRFTMIDQGTGYSSVPIVTISSPSEPISFAQTAVGIASLGTNKNISTILVSNPGTGYTDTPTVEIQPPPVLVGFGTYVFNEIVTGSSSGTTARVKSWDQDTKILKVSFVNDSSKNGFYPGEVLVGSISSASYSVNSYINWDLYDKYGENKLIEDESDSILDFSEKNPFGIF
jgi:hypothetical protein